MTLNQQTAQKILDSAGAAAASLANSYPGSFVTGGSNALRRGWRGWVQRWPGRYAWRRSVHDDGAVTFGCQLNTTDGTESHDSEGARTNQCASVYVEAALADGAALLREASRALDVVGGLRIRTGIVSPTDQPLFIRALEGHSHRLLDITYSEPIVRFRPVTADIDPLSDWASYLAALREIAMDLVNQGGVQNLRVLHEPD